MTAALLGFVAVFGLALLRVPLAFSMAGVGIVVLAWITTVALAVVGFLAIDSGWDLKDYR